MRELASIQTITALHSIDGRDRIMLADVEGWHVIVKKDEFQVGDQCVYVEIDSVMPDKPEYDFLRKSNFRIKTMKLGGVISQGICFPLSVLPHGIYEDGQNVTDLIGVAQYEPTMDREPRIKNAAAVKRYPAPLMKMKWFRDMIYKKDHRGSKAFPEFISKTDETRIQNCPWMLQNKEPVVLTEKVDGQSGSFSLVKRKTWYGKTKYEYIVCSRNLRLFNHDNSSYWTVSDRYHIERCLQNMIGSNDWVAIQGECIGPGIQKNKYNLKDYELRVFNVIYPKGRLGSLAAKKLCDQQRLEFVPIVDESFVLPDTVDEMLKIAHATSALGGTTREGLVVRSQDGKQSFKAVDPLFLLKYDE